MKALPVGKGEVLLYRCQVCEEWKVPHLFQGFIGWETRSLAYVVPNEKVWHSDYSGRDYYLDDAVSTADLRFCHSCGEFITNNYDGDEEDNTAVRTKQVWQCSNCLHIYAEKNEADACCT